ncbi:hypothetical protein F5888DRAFT_1844657 [Russula emetica]|nr:hypothetical protein F5888DRAFT_1844657 [Russula emetica]
MHRLEAESNGNRSPPETWDVNPTDLTLFTERLALDASVSRAVQATGDAGLQADVFRLQQIPQKKRALQHERLRLKRCAAFLQKEWGYHHNEELRIRAEEERITQRLIAAKAVQRIEPFLSFFDNHEHLTPAATRNGIIRNGWAHLQQRDIYASNKPSEREGGPQLNRPTMPEDEVPLRGQAAIEGRRRHNKFDAWRKSVGEPERTRRLLWPTSPSVITWAGDLVNRTCMAVGAAKNLKWTIWPLLGSTTRWRGRGLMHALAKMPGRWQGHYGFDRNAPRQVMLFSFLGTGMALLGRT